MVLSLHLFYMSRTFPWAWFSLHEQLNFAVSLSHIYLPLFSIAPSWLSKCVSRMLISHSPSISLFPILRRQPRSFASVQQSAAAEEATQVPHRLHQPTDLRAREAISLSEIFIARGSGPNRANARTHQRPSHHLVSKQEVSFESKFDYRIIPWKRPPPL